jgi:hypothetical protein
MLWNGVFRVSVRHRRGPAKKLMHHEKEEGAHHGGGECASRVRV